MARSRQRNLWQRPNGSSTFCRATYNRWIYRRCRLGRLNAQRHNCEHSLVDFAGPSVTSRHLRESNLKDPGRIGHLRAQSRVKLSNLRRTEGNRTVPLKKLIAPGDQPHSRAKSQNFVCQASYHSQAAGQIDRPPAINEQINFWPQTRRVTPRHPDGLSRDPSAGSGKRTRWPNRFCRCRESSVTVRLGPCVCQRTNHLESRSPCPRNSQHH